MAHRHIALKGISRPIAGRQWEFDAALRIGRHQDVEVCLEDASVSKHHAEIAPSPQGWVLRDLESTNGTLVNGVRAGNSPRKLRLNDVIQCGALSVAVVALEQELPPPPAAGATRKPSPLEMTQGFVTIQAVAQRSWEQGLEALDGYNDQRLRHGKHFLTLLRGGYHLSHLRSLDDMLQSVLEDTVALLDAQRGSFLLKDPATGRLRLRATATPAGAAASENCFSATLAKRCLKEGQSLLCRDVTADLALQRTQSIIGGGMASIICALVRSPQSRLGVLHLDRGPLQEPFTQDEFHLADAIAASIAVGVECAHVVEDQRGYFLRDLGVLAQRALELHHPETAAHGRRVTAYALLLAQELKLSAEECHQVQVGAPLHDIGKLAFEGSLLQSPGPLTADEERQLQAHPLQGVALVEGIADLAPVLPIIRSHHEEWDGRGYPDGLAGEAIPRLARVVALADAFDLMTSGHPHHPNLTLDQAFAEVEDQAGRRFDPECVAAFLHLRPRVEALFASEDAFHAPFELPVATPPPRSDA